MAAIGTAARTAFTPKLVDPYHGEGEVADFCYETDLVILRKPEAVRMGEDREADYIIAAPYQVSFTVGGIGQAVIVPQGMLTDLTSVPRGFRWLIERVGPHLEAAIIHDFLYIAWQDLGREATREDWRYANRVMIAGMRRAGISRFMCAIIAFAIATPFAWWAYRKPNPLPRYIDLMPAPAASREPRTPASGQSEDAETAHPPSV